MEILNSIVLNKFDAKGNLIEYDFEKFKEAEACTLNRFEINDEIIDKLNQMKNLKMLVFNHCVFQNEKKLENNIENLIITYSKNVRLNTIFNTKKINQLMLTKLEKIDMKELNIFENLQKLSIFECEIDNFSEIIKLEKLQNLKLDGSKIDNTEVLEEIKNNIDVQYKEMYHVGF